ncbi:hypothetical protein [Streptomyces sp. NBC_01565]|uniref:hypothetical protein n=1 Tax=Streptomyces sp. NBC_01565 TaxID=2975881 RepID=UPI0022589FB6|nr:hypothetical protein [Streptomyces sp. NBC_01565]MCX4543800.1 hypothetical protein [Streptomyces sp. NBC_01565]
MRFTLIETPLEAEQLQELDDLEDVEAAWIEHAYRQDVARRYFTAIHNKDPEAAAFVWLEAEAYDKAHEGSSPLADELDFTDLPAAA